MVRGRGQRPRCPEELLLPALRGIPGGIGQAPDGHPGHVIFYVSVDDIDAALAKAESLGGKAEMGPMEIPAGRIAHFSDPEGHTVGFWEQAGS